LNKAERVPLIDYTGVAEKAMARNKPNVFKLMYKMGKVKPTCPLLVLVCRAGFIEIVRDFMLSKELTVDGIWTMAADIAMNHGHVEIVRLLLSNEKVKSQLTCITAFLAAITNNKSEVFEVLLRESGVDPNFNNNMFIRYAAKIGKLEIVKFLMTNSSVDPADMNNEAAREAYEGRHVEVVLALLTDPRVKLPEGFDIVELKKSRDRADALSSYYRVQSMGFVSLMPRLPSISYW